MRSDATTLLSDRIRPSEEARHLTPASVVGGRYRLIGPVGSGGMGIVYRADDLKIGHPVALKFIPPSVANDPERIARLIDEVRVGRQVAHPNVCRLFDIAESDGLHFIAMELVDGEDLASLLTRVGRLEHAKALDLARDICSGLAAAHDLHIIHRDLKPSNVMIDGRGRARIMDFGLATSAAETHRYRGITGTPGYMAPEQARGEPVTIATDIFTLGIVLYEMFTGHQAYAAESATELMALIASGTPPLPPSTVAPDIDANVEEVILRCMARDPRERPSSAREVQQALNARDVLAAAAEEGETPLPEVVAAAGARGNLRPVVAWSLAALTLACTIAGVMSWQASDRGRLLRQLKSPQWLREHAAELAARFAPGTGGAEHFNYEENYTLVGELAKRRHAEQWQPLLDKPHEAMHFWYRRGAALAPSFYRRVSFDDPPHIEAGSVAIDMDGAGRLRRFRHVPASAQAAKQSWAPFFAAAGLDIRAARSIVAPDTALPPVPADRIDAWRIGELTVIGGSRGGVPVFFDVLTTVELKDRRFDGPMHLWAITFFGAVMILICVTALLLARRNVNRGRVDRRGAWLLSMLVFVTFTTSWLLDTPAVKFMEGVAYGVLAGVVASIAYIALEPYVRRRWPAILVGWSRLLHGRARDPHVGRDVLIGLAAAAVSRVVVALAATLLERSGRPDIAPTSLRLQLSARAVVSEVVYNIFLAVLMALLFLFLLYLVALVVRRRSIAAIVVCAVLALAFVADGGVVVIGLMIVVVVLDRFGLLAGMATAYGSMLQAEIITFDLDRWYSGPSLLSAAILGALTLMAARRAAAVSGRAPRAMDASLAKTAGR